MANTLNSNPNVVNYGEVLGPWTMPHKLHHWALKAFGISYEKYLDYIWKNGLFFNAAQAYSAYSHKRKKIPINYKIRKNITTLGIKDFYVHVQNYQLEDYFINQKQLTVIHLRRDNLLKRLVSAMLMNKVGVVSTEQKENKDIKAEIDIEKLMRNLVRDANLNNAELEFVRKLEQRHPIYRVSYEDYFKDEVSLNSHNQQIFEFIGAEPIYQKSSHKKILSNDLKEVVGNYDELVKVIKSTPYEKYLYQD